MHYIAKITLIKVDEEERRDGVGYDAKVTKHRVVKTVGSVVVPAKTVEELRTKATAHLNLMEDGGDIDDSERRTR